MKDIIAQIIQIEQETFGDDGVNRDTLGSILEAFPQGLITIVENGILKGYLAWEKHLKEKFPPYNHHWKDTHDRNGRAAYISIITVKKEFRNQGFGTELLKLLEERAREDGCIKIYCPVNKKHPYLKKGVMHFWKKNGFKITDEIEWELEDGVVIPSYVFSKSL
jgi:ribosomal protein S18 acetylase RimI-like enzyme